MTAHSGNTQPEDFSSAEIQNNPGTSMADTAAGDRCDLIEHVRKKENDSIIEVGMFQGCSECIRQVQ